MPNLTDILPDHLKNRLNIIRQALSGFWEQKPHQHFTNHGLTYSEGVQEKLAQLAQELPQVHRLTPDEIFIVSAAAWLYEIGMQSSILVRPVISFDYQLGDVLSLGQLQELREKKHLLTAYLIENSLTRVHKQTPIFLGLSQPIDDYTRLILQVCKNCSNVPLEEIPEQRPVEGKVVRTGLLVALLRLADQLYINRSRVNLDLLERARKEVNLPMDGFAKWWVYNYAQTLPIVNGQIRFHYDIPETQQEYLVHIRALIERDFDYDNNPNVRYLWDNYNLRLMSSRKSDVAIEPVDFKREMGEELLMHFRPSFTIHLRLGQYVNNQYHVVEQNFSVESYFQLAKAWDKILRRNVTIKSLRLDQKMPEGVVEQFQKKLLLEAQILAGLKHPGIVQIHAIISEPLGIVLEWVDSPSLQAILNENGRLAVAEIINIGLKLADILNYLHKQGVVHRNIKPGNILLTEKSDVILVDFFIARSSLYPDIALLSDGSYGYVGTKQYSAPEQFTTPESIDSAADLFALGVVLYELLTGTLPYEYGNLPELYDGNRFPKPEQFDIPESLYSILCSLLNQSTAQRPTAAQLQESLTTCLNLLETEQKDIEVR